MRSVMACVMMGMFCVQLAADEPASQTQITALTKRLAELEATNAKLLQTIERLEGRIHIEQHKPTKGAVDEVTLAESGRGRWIIHPTVGVPVFARHEFIVTSFGASKVIQLVRKNGQPVPIDAVYFGESTQPTTPQATGATLNFGGR